MECLATQTGLGAILGRLRAVITGDHEIFRAISGVRSAGTTAKDNNVCARCRATKRDVLNGDPFCEWEEQLHAGDLLPEVTVDMRCECPLHGTRIIASQLLKYTCQQLRAVAINSRIVMDLKRQLNLEAWDEDANLDHTFARDLLSDKARLS